MDNYEQAIKDFIKIKYDKFQYIFRRAEELRLEFVKQFPIKQIESMKLDDYVVGKGQESFCYWMETKLKELGSIKGGSTADKKFGVYYNKKKGEYKTISKWDSGLNVDYAFRRVKKAIKDVLIAGDIDDTASILNNPLSPMFKNKILTTYYPEKYLNVFSNEHVNYFIKKLGIQRRNGINIEEKRKLLLNFKNNNELLSGFSNFMFMSFLYDWSNPKVRQIRLLPMSSKFEFPDMDYESIQRKFFLDELINISKGKYNFRSTGINAPTGTLILFQIDNAIIASAKLSKVIKYDEPLEYIYKGCYIFDTDSIKVFKPIVAEKLREIDANFKSFSQVKQKLDPTTYEEIMELINLRSQTFITEEISFDDTKKYIEGAKKQITVNAYERNAKAREACIKKHGSSCAICGFDFGENYGEEFAGKIHVHHIVPLNELDGEYEVNPETDMIPVCPNCHMILHSKVGNPYTIQQVKEFLEK